MQGIRYTLLYKGIEKRKIVLELHSTNGKKF